MTVKYNHTKKNFSHACPFSIKLDLKIWDSRPYYSWDFIIIILLIKHMEKIDGHFYTSCASYIKLSFIF